MSGACQLGPGWRADQQSVVAEPQGEPPCSGPGGQCLERSEGGESGEPDVTAKDRHFQQWGRHCHIRRKSINASSGPRQ